MLFPVAARENGSKKSLVVTSVPMQQQQGGADCGLFAIAHACHAAQDEMLHDHLVCGIGDSRIQRHLLSESALTFARALSLPRQQSPRKRTPSSCSHPPLQLFTPWGSHLNPHLPRPPLARVTVVDGSTHWTPATSSPLATTVAKLATSHPFVMRKQLASHHWSRHSINLLRPLRGITCTLCQRIYLLTTTAMMPRPLMPILMPFSHSAASKPTPW